MSDAVNNQPAEIYEGLFYKLLVKCRQRKGAIKLHCIYDHSGAIPSFRPKSSPTSTRPGGR